MTLILFSCSSSNKIAGNKFDPFLKQKVSDLIKNDDESKITVLGKSKNEISDEMKKKIELTGVSIQTVAGEIFTAVGTAKEIINLAELDFIVIIELSQNREPKSLNKIK
jgi:hypothetical protein